MHFYCPFLTQHTEQWRKEIVLLITKIICFLAVEEAGAGWEKFTHTFFLEKVQNKWVHTHKGTSGPPTRLLPHLDWIYINTSKEFSHFGSQAAPLLVICTNSNISCAPYVCNWCHNWLTFWSAWLTFSAFIYVSFAFLKGVFTQFT